jgi:hypothetical protein
MSLATLQELMGHKNVIDDFDPRRRIFNLMLHSALQ